LTTPFRTALSGFIAVFLLALCACSAVSSTSAESSASESGAASGGGSTSGNSSAADSGSSADAWASPRSSASSEITVVVLGGLNGSPIGGASVSVVDSTNTALSGSPFTADGEGKVSLTGELTPGSSYSITASKSGLASAERLDYVAAAGTIVALYCLPLSMSGVGAAAPTLVSVQYSSDKGNTWADMGSGAKLAAGFEIKAKVAGAAAVEATSMSGFGVKIDLDRMPTSANGFEATSFKDNVKSSLDTTVSSATRGKFVTDAVFDLSSDNFVSGAHTLELVAYDAACNRVEKRLDFNITTAPTAGTTITSSSYSDLALDFITYDTSTDAASSSCIRSSLSFKLSRSKSILGFDVYRSSDGTSYDRVARVNFGDFGTDYSYSDFDPALERNKTYYYYARAFSNDPGYSGYWADSPAVSATFLGPFSLSLVSPVSGSSISSSGLASSALTFMISNTALWSASVADYFYFSLLVKDKAGDPAFYGEYRYDFSAEAFEAPGGYDRTGAASWSQYKALSSGAMAYSGGTISIDLSKACAAAYADTYGESGLAASLVVGSAYEWDIFGAWEGSGSAAVGSSSAMMPAYFEKAGSSTSAGSGIGYAYGNTFSGGVGGKNGAFEFDYE